MFLDRYAIIDHAESDQEASTLGKGINGNKTRFQKLKSCLQFQPPIVGALIALWLTCLSPLLLGVESGSRDVER